MAVYPFYNGYNIDDALIDCGKIIIVDCQGLHTYIDPCSLLATCMIARPAINRCGMIPGIVPGQPGIASAAALRILRVNAAANCVEFVDPGVAFTDTDRLVTVTPNDTTPGGLFAKIVSCDPNIVITVLNPGGNEILQICGTAGCKSFLCLTDVPDAYPACPNLPGPGFVMFNPSPGSGVVFQCNRAGYRGTRYINGDITLNQAPNTISFHYIPMTKFEGNPNMDNVLGSADTVEVLEDAMYDLWLKGNLVINQGVQSFRVTIVVVNSAFPTGDHSALFCVDSKFGADVPFPLVPAGQVQRFYNVGGNTLIKLRQNDNVFLIVRMDSNAGTGVPATMTLSRSALGSGTLTSGVNATSSHPGLSYGVNRRTDQMFNAEHFY